MPMMPAIMLVVSAATQPASRATTATTSTAVAMPPIGPNRPEPTLFGRPAASPRSGKARPLRASIASLRRRGNALGAQGTGTERVSQYTALPMGKAAAPDAGQDRQRVV